MKWPPKRLSLYETGSPAYTRTRLAQSSDSELQANTDWLPRQSDSRDAASASQWYGHRELTPSLRSHSQGQICTPRPLNNTTNRAYLLPHQLLGKQMWQQPCAYCFSKTSTLSWRFRHTFSAYDVSLFWHTSSFTSDHPHYFELFSNIFPTKSSHFGQFLKK